MSNLLPRKEAESIQKKTLVRVMIVAGWILAASMLVSTLVLVPTYIVARSQMNVLSEEIAVLQESLAVQQETIDRDELSNARQHINALNELADGDIRPGEAIRAMLARKPDAIRIHNIQYNRSGGGGELVIAGSSSGMRQLTEYADLLRTESLFATVNVPVTALVHASEGAFTMTITGEF